MKNIKSAVEEHVSRNIKTYIILVVIFLLGLIIGIIVVNTSTQDV